MTTHPHLEGLIRKWRSLSRHEDESGELEVGDESAIRLRLCADELEAALAALPGGGVCWCATCRPVTFGDMRMVLCPDCGNKRCPHANDHRNACTGSNEPGQPGSAYPTPTPNPHEADRNG